MKAIVCDKCGKVMPQPDFNEYRQPEGVNVLRYWGAENNGHRNMERAEVCDECADELLAFIRKEGSGET